jgi:hypothetical protein
MQVLNPGANLTEKAPYLGLTKSSAACFFSLYHLLQVSARCIIKNQNELLLVKEAVVKRDYIRVLHLLQQSNFFKALLTARLVSRVEFDQLLHHYNQPIHLSLCLVHIRELPLAQNLAGNPIIVHTTARHDVSRQRGDIVRSSVTAPLCSNALLLGWRPRRRHWLHHCWLAMDLFCWSDHLDGSTAIAGAVFHEAHHGL